MLMQIFFFFFNVNTVCRGNGTEHLLFTGANYWQNIENNSKIKKKKNERERKRKNDNFFHFMYKSN